MPRNEPDLNDMWVRGELAASAAGCRALEHHYQAAVDAARGKPAVARHRRRAALRIATRVLSTMDERRAA